MVLLGGGAYAYADTLVRDAQNAIAGGRSLAHWKYTEAERIAWESHERSTGMGLAWQQAALIFVAALVVPALMTWSSGIGGAVKFAFLPIVLPMAGLWLKRSEVNGRCARALDPGREAYVSGDGIWTDGRLFLFERIRNLELVWGAIAYARFTVTGDDSEVRVQIPRGCEKEAVRLLQRSMAAKQALATTLGPARTDMM